MATARNQVRIIGGEWRSRVIAFPPRADLRPTPDRVRETLFNWLGQDLTGKCCLDLFAGSGALGFEAASRGARRVVMVERDRDVAKALRESALTLGAQSVEIIEGDALGFVARAAERFDVAFVDPPFAGDLAAKILERRPPCLRRHGPVYVESAAPLELPPPWHALRAERAGAVRYALYEFLP